MDRSLLRHHRSTLVAGRGHRMCTAAADRGPAWLPENQTPVVHVDICAIFLSHASVRAEHRQCTDIQCNRTLPQWSHRPSSVFSLTAREPRPPSCRMVVRMFIPMLYSVCVTIVSALVGVVPRVACCLGECAVVFPRDDSAAMGKQQPWNESEMHSINRNNHVRRGRWPCRHAPSIGADSDHLPDGFPNKMAI